MSTTQTSRPTSDTSQDREYTDSEDYDSTHVIDECAIHWCEYDVFDDEYCHKHQKYAGEERAFGY